MIRSVTQKRWIVVLILFLFMTLHQIDALLINPLASQIMAHFNFELPRFTLINTITIIVTAVFYTIWGIFFDRHTRKKLIALSAFMWGATAWLRIIAPTFATFLVSQAASGVDDASVPGIFSLVGDFFRPWNRGKIFGLLQLTQPLAYLSSLVLALVIGNQFGWQALMVFTGFMGLLMAFLVYFGVPEPKRGISEPEFSSFKPIGMYIFDWELARNLFTKPVLVLIFVQGFIAVIPWNAITFWLIPYLLEDRQYTYGEINLMLVSLFLVIALGYAISGWLGDFTFNFLKKGRIIISFFGVLLSAVLIYFTVRVPISNNGVFTTLIMLTGFFMTFPRPNILATIFDLTLPEVRSSALAILYLFQLLGTAGSTLLIRRLETSMSLGAAMQWLGGGAWGLCAVLLGIVSFLVPAAIRNLRRHMAYRSYLESRLAGKQPADLNPEEL
jgi:MFS family permease